MRKRITKSRLSPGRVCLVCSKLLEGLGSPKHPRRLFCCDEHNFKWHYIESSEGHISRRYIKKGELNGERCLQCYQALYGNRRTFCHRACRYQHHKAK